MQRQSFARNRPESNRQEGQGKQENQDVNEHLFSRVINTRQQMRVHVSQQQHELEEENAGGPDCCGAAEVGQQHLANHRLANEKEERA